MGDDTMEETTCGGYIDEAGEFWDEDKGENVLAHAQCGIDAELPLA